MAKEGISTIVLLICAALILSVGSLFATRPYLLILTILLWVFVIFSFYFFRNPKRHTPAQPGAIIAPADGRVRSIATARENEFLKSDALHVVIYLSLFDVHITRSPVAGRVEHLKYQRGKFHAAYSDDAGVTNEQTSIGISSSVKIVLKQIAGTFARRIVCHIREGDVVSAGEKIGMIKFGSRVDMYLPTSTRLCISKGDTLRGGESIIGTLSDE